MPYIKRETRNIFDPPLNKLIFELRCEYIDRYTREVGKEADGSVNYIICRIIDAIYGNRGYFEYARAIGLLESAKLEYYRRKVVELENTKIKENGDVANGFISLEMTMGEGREKISQAETVNTGYFLINVSLPKNIKAGAYSILLSAYEKDSSEETTNIGSATTECVSKPLFCHSSNVFIL